MSNLPPLPAGFVLDPDPQSGGGNLPPLPPGFVLDGGADTGTPGHTNPDGSYTPARITIHADPSQGHPVTVGDRAAELRASTSAPSGLYNNMTAGVNDALFRVPGAPVDALNTIVLRPAAAALHAVGGPDIELPVDPVGGHQFFANLATHIGVNDPAQVQANGEGDKLARALGEGIGYAVAPEAGLSALSKAAVVAPKVMEALRPFIGSTDGFGAVAKNAFASGVSAVGGEAAADAAPDQWKPLAATAGALGAGGIASLLAEAPSVARAGGRVAADFVAPLTTAGQRQQAGQQLYRSADDPHGVIEALIGRGSTAVPGSEPTTFQASGDMGLGALERGVAARNPAEFMQRRADQNSARLAALNGIQPAGAPEQVAAAVSQHVAGIHQQADADTAAALKYARDAMAGLGDGTTPEAAGATLRQMLEDARAGAKTRERVLWQAVDPEGTMALGIQGSKDEAQSILKGITPMAAKPSADEMAIYSDILKSEGDAIPLSHVTDLQSRLKTAMRVERMTNGESAAWRRMSMLNGAVQGDLENAIVRRAAQERQAVASGRMSPEQTAAFRVQQWQDDWHQRQAQAGALDTGSLGPNGGARATSVSGPRRTAGQGGVGPRNPSGDPGLSPDAGNLDQSAVDRLRAARGATLERVNTYDNKTLAPMRSRPSGASPYDMPAAAVPGRIFFPGPSSVDAITTYRQAVGDGQALPALEQYAVDRLRRAAANEDGTLNPAKTANWMRAHADALRSFPALGEQVRAAAAASERAAGVAQAGRETVDEAQRGVLGRLMGLSHPEDVSRAIGAVFARQDSVAQMAAIRRAIGDNRDAQEGLRKAVASYIADRFIGNTEAATTGTGLLKSDQFQTFINRNGAALKAAGFEQQSISMLENIAADLQRANRSITAVKLPGGSNTTQDVLAAKVLDSPTTMITKIAIASAVSGGGAGFLAGPVVGAATTVATGIIGALRQHGLTRIDELVKQAMLDPDLAVQLLREVKPKDVPAAAVDIGQRFRRAVVAGNAATVSESGKSDRSGDIARLLAAPSPSRRNDVARALMNSGSTGVGQATVAPRLGVADALIRSSGATLHQAGMR